MIKFMLKQQSFSQRNVFSDPRRFLTAKMFSWAGEVAPSLSPAKMKSKVREQGTYMYCVQPRFNQYFGIWLFPITLQWRNREIQREFIIWLVVGTYIRVFVEMTLFSCALLVNSIYCSSTVQMWISFEYLLRILNQLNLSLSLSKIRKENKKNKLILVQERRNYDALA